jgi:ankyrin repeat protein
MPRVQLLLSASGGDASIKETDGEGYTALLWAARYSRLPVLPPKS